MVGLLLVALVVGAWTFQDFGLSWDEPLFYQYADSIGYAYSLRDRLSGTFDLERAFGPSSDHKIYGPAYLLLGRFPALAVEAVFGADHQEAWHLVNFIIFELGAFGLFMLCRRWMSPWSALAASVLFLTQPVLWGHGFVNPKDIPFMTFFIITVETGLRMVDRLVGNSLRFDRSPGDVADHQDSKAPSARIRRLHQSILVAGLMAAGMALAAAVFHGELSRWLTEVVLKAYYGSSQSWLHRMFTLVARDASRLTEDYYIDRALQALSQVRTAGAVAALLVAPLCIDRLLQPRASEARFGSMIDRMVRAFRALDLGSNRLGFRQTLAAVWLPALLLGVLTGIRVLGPWAGILVVFYYLIQPRDRSLLGVALYGTLAAIVTWLTWPYLWAAPVARFLEVAGHMAQNPQILPVLFDGSVFPSNGLPAAYLPTQLALTLTEPTFPLAAIGMGVAFFRWQRGRLRADSFLVVIAWLAAPFLYVWVRRPPMYDGYRHFLFFLPPLFVCAGLAFDGCRSFLRTRWVQFGLAILLAAPGGLAIASEHPYAYAHYNQFAGGLSGAFRNYETDFWLTCYKETLSLLQARSDLPRTVYVLRNPGLAQHYAGPEVEIAPFEADVTSIPAGTWLLLTTRSNIDLAIRPGDPTLMTVGREGAVFCVVKSVGEVGP